MIILKQKTYSEKLKDSRIGIGWIQDGNGKVDAEKYFRVGKEAAGKEATLDNIGKPIGKATKRGVIAGVGGYLISKSPDFIENNAKNYGLDIKIPQNIKSSLGKNSKKIAMGAAVLGATSVIAKEAPKIIKKRKAARLGAEINTKERIKKSKKK